MLLVSHREEESLPDERGRQQWQMCRRTFGTDTHLVLGVVLEETFDTSARELE